MELVPVQRWMDPKTPPPYSLSSAQEDYWQAYYDSEERAEFLEKKEMLEYQRILCNTNLIGTLLKTASLCESKGVSLLKFWIDCQEVICRSLSPVKCLADYNVWTKKQIEKDLKKCRKQKGKRKKKN